MAVGGGGKIPGCLAEPPVHDRQMIYRMLGKTGFRASVMGLGCGGHSRLGLRKGNTDREAIRVVERAIELGINFFDTAESYGTEEHVGRALRAAKTDRSKVFLATKMSLKNVAGANDILKKLENSLRRLQTDCIDLYQLHGIGREALPFCLETIMPVLEKARAAGKIRFIGITERFEADREHAMLEGVLPEGVFDVVMVGYNMLNQSAAEHVLPLCREQGTGTLVMFAVRRALTSPEQLQPTLEALRSRGELDPGEMELSDPLPFLTRHEPDPVPDLPDLAYRFVRDEPGTDVILVGTGNLDHLRRNCDSLLKPPLQEETRSLLRQVFGRCRSVSADLIT